MTSQLSKPQKAIVKAAKEFAKGEFESDLAQDLDRAGEFPRAIWKKAADLGFIGIHLPEAYGGGGMSMLEQVLVAETFCSRDSTMGSAIMLAGVGAEWLHRFAGAEVKEKYLPGILEGRILPGIALPKPGVAISIAKPATGDVMHVNADVKGVMNGGLADVYFLPFDGGFAIIDADQDGVAVDETHEQFGLRMTASARMRFENALLSWEKRVSIKQGGISPLLSELRILFSALALGIARGAIDRSLAHVKKREQFGRKLAGFQVLRHKLAKMETGFFQARCLTFSAAESFSSRNVSVASDSTRSRTHTKNHNRASAVSRLPASCPKIMFGRGREI